MWKSVQFYGVNFLLLLHVFWGMTQATRLAWSAHYLLGHLSCYFNYYFLLYKTA